MLRKLLNTFQEGLSGRANRQAHRDAWGQSAIKAPKLQEPEQFRLSGPYSSENLTIFLVHGADKMSAPILTLEEALAEKKVVVDETGNVETLTIRSLSEDYVFLQSGDIVKGGRQDRTIRYDLVLPKGKKVELPTFCVEQGRWSQRQGESVSEFSSSENYFSGRSMKVAARYLGCQNEVWASVASNQSKLQCRAGFDSSRLESTTSFELTMDDDAVKGAANKHIEKLQGILDGKDDVTGFVFALNGQLNSADVYACNALFRKLWAKLLKSAAVEAVSESADGEFSQVTTAEVLKFLAEPQRRPARMKYSTRESVVREQEGSVAIVYRTQWCNDIAGNAFIHSSFLAKS